MNQYLSLINRLIAGIVIIIVTLLITTQLSIYIRSMSIDACAKIGRIDRVNAGGLKESFPHEDFYQKCLITKGVK
jgi:hypothetical protein